jgi:hypothetical protein
LRISGPVLAAVLLLSSPLALATASDAAAATERAAGRNYHTLAKIKKTKVQACIGPVRETAAGPGVPLYVRLDNRRARLGATARVMTNLLQRDYNAAPHGSDSGKYAIVSVDENVRVMYSAYRKTENFEIVAAAIPAC